MSLPQVSAAASGPGWVAGTSLVAGFSYLVGTISSGILSLLAWFTADDPDISSHAANGIIYTILLAVLGYLGTLTTGVFADRKSRRENDSQLLRLQYENRVKTIEMENVAAKIRRESEREFSNGQMLRLHEQVSRLNDALHHTSHDLQITGREVTRNAHAIEQVADSTGAGPVATARIPAELGQIPGADGHGL